MGRCCRGFVHVLHILGDIFVLHAESCYLHLFARYVTACAKRSLAGIPQGYITPEVIGKLFLAWHAVEQDADARLRNQAGRLTLPRP